MNIFYNVVFHQVFRLLSVIKLSAYQPLHRKGPAGACLFFQQHCIFFIFFFCFFQLRMNLAAAALFTEPDPALQLAILFFHLI